MMTPRLFLEVFVIALLCFVGAIVWYLCFHPEPKGPAAPVAPREVLGVEDSEHFLEHAGRKRRYLVHVPRTHDGKSPLPVVLGFHGGGGRAESFRTVSRLNEAADRHGFLVVYPDGTGRRPHVLTFNAGRCCGYAMEEQVDDVGFVRKLLDALPKQYPVDAQRIYATGMSNGAMLCYRLAGELSDRLAAIAPVAGTMAMDEPPPGQPVPVLHFHGQKDGFAPFEGGKGPLGGKPQSAVRDTIAWWVKRNQCGAEPVEEQKGTDYLMQRYAPPPGVAGAPVVLYTLPEGGHTWPGGVDLTWYLGTGKLIPTVAASELLWQFFSAQRRTSSQ